MGIDQPLLKNLLMVPGGCLSLRKLTLSLTKTIKDSSEDVQKKLFIL